MLPRLLALSAVLTAGISSAQAIEISTIRHNASMVFVVSGEIEAGDADKFATVWEKETYDAFRFTVALDSPVGSLVEGMKLDEFFRKQVLRPSFRNIRQSRPCRATGITPRRPRRHQAANVIRRAL